MAISSVSRKRNLGIEGGSRGAKAALAIPRKSDDPNKIVSRVTESRKGQIDLLDGDRDIPEEQVNDDFRIAQQGHL